MPPHHPSMFGGHPPGFPPGALPDHWPYGPGPDFGPGIPDYQFNNNNEPLKKRRGRKKRKVDEFAAMNGYMEVSKQIPSPPIYGFLLFSPIKNTFMSPCLFTTLPYMATELHIGSAKLAVFSQATVKVPLVLNLFSILFLITYSVNNFSFRAIHPEWRVMVWVRQKPRGREPHSSTTSFAL